MGKCLWINRVHHSGWIGSIQEEAISLRKPVKFYVLTTDGSDWRYYASEAKGGTNLKGYLKI